MIAAVGHSDSFSKHKDETRGHLALSKKKIIKSKLKQLLSLQYVDHKHISVEENKRPELSKYQTKFRIVYT